MHAKAAPSSCDLKKQPPRHKARVDISLGDSAGCSSFDFGRAGRRHGLRVCSNQGENALPQKKQQDPAAKGADMKQTRLHDELCATDLPAGVDALVIGDQSSMKHGIAALVEVSQA